LELVDVKRPPEGLRGIVVGNVFHRAFVLGPRRDGLDAHARRATLTVGSRDHTADRPARDPVATVRSVARVLEGCGERLLGGDWILTGSLVHVPVAPGDDLAGVVDGLGQVTIHIAPEAQT
jgi:2-keto-4-pentenoate hydratase